MFRRCLLLAGIAACVLDTRVPAAAAANLVRDGAFEEVNRHAVLRWPYLEKAVKSGVEVSREGDEVVLPANFSQFIDTRLLKVVEGKAGAEVHSGTRAILLAGGVYLQPATPHSYKTREGEMYSAEFYVKWPAGAERGPTGGDVNLWLHVYGTGKTYAMRLETKGKPNATEWTKIEQTFLVVGAGAEEIFPRLESRQPVLIDDLVLRKLSAEPEPPAEDAYASPRDRSKALFVYPVKTAPSLDGKLDDPCWQEIPEFSGFLSYGDQAVLAQPVTKVRLGFDAQNLYAGITCVESDLSLLSLLDPYRDMTTEKWIGPTAVEVFLDPGRSRLEYFHFATTARGHKYEALGMDSTWSAAWDAKEAVTKEGYSIEVRIPFASLAVRTPAVGDVWGLNICRQRDTTHSTLFPVGPNFHRPAGFGPMVFGSLDQWYREAFLHGAEQRRAAIQERTANSRRHTPCAEPAHGVCGLLSEIDSRVKLIDAYVAEVKARVEKDPVGGQKDGRRIAELYGMGGLALDSYERILARLDWAVLGERR